MEMTSGPDFTSETLAWLKAANLRDRQSKGQYMTPRPLRSYLLGQLNFKPGDKVLDPAVGTGEFLRQALEVEPGIEVTGWDIDSAILEAAAKNCPTATLICRSGLEDYEGELFDFVIGNPPYFELKLDSSAKEKFHEVVNGRPNIYGLFFQVGLDALKPGGTLAYVVPPSMNAGAYFKNLRKYLTRTNHVVSLKVFNDSSMFVDAQTSVQVIVVRKGVGESNHTFEVNDSHSGVTSLVFCEDPKAFAKLYEGCVSLASLGYEAVTGSTVWNQHKESLVNDVDSDSTVPLLYARNIVDGGISLSPDERRPQFIRGGRTMVGEAIVVNRIIGGVGKGVIKAGLIPDGFRFAAENHLNVIRPIVGVTQKVSFSELFELITAPEIIEKARTLTGNTQLSATEWTYLIPIRQRTQI
jgi:adenine-specific DNA-methyltransferase